MFHANDPVSHDLVFMWCWELLQIAPGQYRYFLAKHVEDESEDSEGTEHAASRLFYIRKGR